MAALRRSLWWIITIYHIQTCLPVPATKGSFVRPIPISSIKQPLRENFGYNFNSGNKIQQHDLLSPMIPVNNLKEFPIPSEVIETTVVKQPSSSIQTSGGIKSQTFPSKWKWFNQERQQSRWANSLEPSVPIDKSNWFNHGQHQSRWKNTLGSASSTDVHTTTPIKSTFNGFTEVKPRYFSLPKPHQTQTHFVTNPPSFNVINPLPAPTTMKPITFTYPQPVPTGYPLPMPTIQPQPFPHPVPSSNPNPVPLPVPFPKPQPFLQQPYPQPMPQPMPQPYPNPIPQPYPQPIPQPIPQPYPHPLPQPMPQPIPQPYPHSIPQPMPKPYPYPMPQPMPQPIPQPHPMPQPMPHPTPGYLQYPWVNPYYYLFNRNNRFTSAGSRPYEIHNHYHVTQNGATTGSAPSSGGSASAHASSSVRSNSIGGGPGFTGGNSGPGIGGDGGGEGGGGGGRQLGGLNLKVLPDGGQTSTVVGKGGNSMRATNIGTHGLGRGSRVFSKSFDSWGQGQGSGSSGGGGTGSGGTFGSSIAQYIGNKLMAQSAAEILDVPATTIEAALTAGSNSNGANDIHGSGTGFGGGSLWGSNSGAGSYLGSSSGAGSLWSSSTGGGAQSGVTAGAGEGLIWNLGKHLTGENEWGSSSGSGSSGGSTEGGNEGGEGSETYKSMPSSWNLKWNDDDDRK